MSICVHNKHMNSLQTVEPALDEACCAPSGQPILSAEDARRTALVFKALADPNRLRLLSVVKGEGSGSTASKEDTMHTEAPTTEDRLHAMLENVKAAAANTRQAMDSPGDEDWVTDGESDAEYLRALLRDTIAKLDTTIRDIEALLAQRLDG